MQIFCLIIDMLKHTISFLFIVLLSTALKANGVVKGTVHDTEREPLVGATVQLKGTEHYAIVGLDGSFVISKIPDGFYEVEVSYVGFKNFSEQVEVNSDTSNLDIIMEFDDDALGEVLIKVKTQKGSDAQARKREKKCTKHH